MVEWKGCHRSLLQNSCAAVGIFLFDHFLSSGIHWRQHSSLRLSDAARDACLVQLICSIGQSEFCAALEARLNIVQDVATCRTEMEFRGPRMGSIFRACFLLPHGYGGTQMWTKNGSGFGGQFLLYFVAFFEIWGAAFSDNFAALPPACVGARPIFPFHRIRHLCIHFRRPDVCEHTGPGSAPVFGVLHPRCVLYWCSRAQLLHCHSCVESMLQASTL